MSAIAVITGGQGELAQAIAAELQREGFAVHTPGREALDVSAAAAVNGYFQELGPVDLLVNSAGIIRDRPVARMSESDWDEVMRVNLRGAFLCCRAVLKGMCRRRGGHIVNVGSFSGLSGPPGQANYAAAKAGLIGLTQSLAREAGGRGVRVNCVLPGFLKTRMTAGLDAHAIEAAVEAHALKRFNTVEDAARFIVFLDREMRHVSGQVFQLDSRVRREL